MDDIVDRITRWLETSYEPDPPNDALLMIDARREIERLRHELSGVWAVANLLASRLETISSGNVMVLQSYDKALQEARRG